MKDKERENLTMLFAKYKYHSQRALIYGLIASFLSGLAIGILWK